MALDIQALLDAPKETLSVEHKAWLDLSDVNSRGTLAKALIALANHGGGHIVVGLRENGAQRAVEERPASIAAYTQDAIASIVRKFADPPFECLLDHLPDPATGVELAVITVVGGLSDIVVSKSGIPGGPIQEFRPYVRKPGPASEMPTSISEWRALFDRCVRARQSEMLDAIRAIVTGSPAGIEGEAVSEQRVAAFAAAALDRWRKLAEGIPKQSQARLPHGYWSVTLKFDGEFERPSLVELREYLRSAGQVNHSGWPPFVFISRDPLSPHPVDGLIEAWLYEAGDDDNPAHADFWRVAPSGEAYMMRGYQEDSRRIPSLEPGKGFDLTTPTWRVGEAVLYAARLAAQFGDVRSVDMLFKFTGLAGRELVSYGNRNRWVYDGRISHQDSYEARVVFAPNQAETELPEIVHKLLFPLYELFAFFSLSRQLVAEELASMQRGRF